MSDKHSQSQDDTVRLMRPPPRVFTNPVGRSVWMGGVEPVELELDEPAANFDPYDSQALRTPFSP